LPVEQEITEKMSFWTGFTGFTQIFILNQETVFVGVNLCHRYQCLKKFKNYFKTRNYTDLHRYLSLFLFTMFIRVIREIRG